MKKIITYNDFVSESVRDKMTPKSDDYIEKRLQDLLEFVYQNEKLPGYTELDFFDSDMKKYFEKYLIGEDDNGINYLLYKDKVFKIGPIVRSNYHTYVYKMSDTIDSIKRKLHIDESIRDKMTPKSMEDVVKNLPKDMGEIYLKSKELGWNIEINGYGINTYLILNFKYLRITIMKYKGKLFANFKVMINPVATSYHIPDPSGYITNFEDLKTKMDSLFKIPILQESLRDKMTPISDSQIDELLKGKSYKQSLNIVTKSKEPDLIMMVMRSDFVTSRQIDDVDMIFKKIVRNNYCRISYEPTLNFEMDLIYGGKIDITRSDNDFLRSVIVGIDRLTESQIEYHKLDGGKMGYPVFWYFVFLQVGSNREKLRWIKMYFDNFDAMVDYIKKSGLDV